MLLLNINTEKSGIKLHMVVLRTVKDIGLIPYKEFRAIKVRYLCVMFIGI